MARIDTLLTELERRAGCEPGTVHTPLAMETALAMRHAYDIAASSPRVNHLMLGCRARRRRGPRRRLSVDARR